MKEKSFRFRESFGRAVRTMTDKQAGKFIKGLCANIFDNNYFTAYDATLKSAYILVKAALEADERDRENGRKGGYISAEKRKTEAFSISVIAQISQPISPLEKMLGSELSEEEQEKINEDEICKESVAKSIEM